MAQAELQVTLREKVGKGSARSTRRAGMVPAVVYGCNMEPAPIAVDIKALKSVISTEAGWNALITLRGAGTYEGKTVILKDLQVQAINRDMVSADFQLVDMEALTTVTVPVTVVGKSEGEKEGGNLELIRKELEVRCLPLAIPTSIDIDVTALEVGDVVHIEDVTAPEDVELVHDVNFTVLTVTGHRDEEEEGDVDEDEEIIETVEETE